MGNENEDWTTATTSVDDAWSQEVVLDEPTGMRLAFENRSGVPIRGYYVTDDDLDDEGQPVNRHSLFDNLTGRAELTVTFPEGATYLCVEVDTSSAEFRFSMTWLDQPDDAQT